MQGIDETELSLSQIARSHLNDIDRAQRGEPSSALGMHFANCNAEPSFCILMEVKSGQPNRVRGKERWQERFRAELMLTEDLPAPDVRAENREAGD